MIVEFYVFGYETVQTCDGFKCVAKLSIRTDEGFKFIDHALIELDEIKAFFESIDVTPFEFNQMPGKEGKCVVEKEYDSYFIKEWLEKGVN